MSWTAYFHGLSWNYTHNTNGMIAAALKDHAGVDVPTYDGPLAEVIGPAWWDELVGKNAEEGAAYLTQIIDGLRADPDTYRAMNPPNGWGSYDTLLATLEDMRAATTPIAVWTVYG